MSANRLLARMRSVTIASILAHATCLAQGAPADAVAKAKADSAKQVQTAQAELTSYYTVPEMPATSILGVTPSSIVRPATQKDFASSLLNAIDQSGKVKQGFALETSLGLYSPFRVDLDTYQKSARARFVSNLAVSLATTQTSGDTSSTDLAWGIRAPLYDGGDALAKRELTDKLAAKLRTCLPGPTDAPVFIPGPGQSASSADSAKRAAAADKRLACLESVVKTPTAEEVSKQAADSNWNVVRAVAGYAGSMRLAQSIVTSRQQLGDRFWFSGSVPLSFAIGESSVGKMVQVIGYADYWHHRGIDTVAAYSTISYGGRLNIGSAKVNGFYELIGERRSDQPRSVSGSGSSWSSGIEFLASQGVWISTGFGKRAQDLLKPDKTVVIANIRWGVSQKTYLNP